MDIRGSGIFSAVYLGIKFILFLNVFWDFTWCDSLLEGKSSDFKSRQFISIFIWSGIFRSGICDNEILLASDEEIMLIGGR